MKKSAIALAVLAASGASFAQVTVTGALSMGYGMTTNVGQTAVNGSAPVAGVVAFVGLTNTAVGGTDQSGFGIDTSSIQFDAKEDLGGGATVAAMMSIDTVDRGTIAGGDAMLTYTNKSFGRIQLGTEKGGAVHSGIPSAGAPVINFDGKLFQQRTSSDFISYAAPIGPIVLVLKHSEPGNNLKSYKAAANNGGLGLGAGAAGSKGQRNTDYLGIYTGGPLQVVGGYRTYDNRDSQSIATTGLTKSDVIIFAAGYDLGAAKVGFGYNITTATVGPKVTDMLLGVNVPLGALSVGATFARATVSGVSDVKNQITTVGAAVAGGIGGVLPGMSLADGSANGYSLGAKYDLSKRTNFTVKYAQWELSGYEQFEYFQATGNLGAFGYKDRMTETSILLNHSF